MNVYIYSGPYPLTKSIDFRNNTVSNIEAEGWTFLNWRGHYTLDANGLTCTWSSDSNDSCVIYFDLPASLTTNNKITISISGYCTTLSSGTFTGGVLSAGIFDYVGQQYYLKQLSAAYSSGDAGNAGETGMKADSTTIGSSGPRRVAGNIEFNATFDLKSKTCSFNLTSPSSFSTTGTLTDSQISTILTYGKACLVCEQFTAPQLMRLYKGSITIE